MADFPASSFQLDGDPGSIRSSASKYGSFGSDATGAAGQVRSLDSSLFIGPEGDQYRQGLNGDLPPHLETTGQAYTMVANALNTFATDLSGLQERMRPLASQAPSLWAALQNAEQALSTAKSNDSTHASGLAQTKAALKPGQQMPPDTYHSDTGAASSSLSSAQQAWTTCLNAANKVKSDLQTDINTCDHQIHIASGMRFHKNPSGWGAMWAGFKGFVKDHVAGLAKLSGVLKTISAVAGVLSLVPGLDVIAAPVALATGAAALAIDASIKLATGQGSWKSIAIDGALMALPGVGKLAKEGVTAFRGARGAESAVTEVSTVTKVEGETSATARRVTLRAGTKRAVYRDGELGPNGEDYVCAASGDSIPCVRNPDGSAYRINAETGRPDPNGITVPEKGTFNFGHEPGHEWRTYKTDAQDRGLTRAQVNDEQNNPDIYRLETPIANQGHAYEMPNH